MVYNKPCYFGNDFNRIYFEPLSYERELLFYNHHKHHLLLNLYQLKRENNFHLQKKLQMFRDRCIYIEGVRDLGIIVP